MVGFRDPRGGPQPEPEPLAAAPPLEALEHPSPVLEWDPLARVLDDDPDLVGGALDRDADGWLAVLHRVVEEHLERLFQLLGIGLDHHRLVLRRPDRELDPADAVPPTLDHTADPLPRVERHRVGGRRCAAPRRDEEPADADRPTVGLLREGLEEGAPVLDVRVLELAEGHREGRDGRRWRPQVVGEPIEQRRPLLRARARAGEQTEAERCLEQEGEHGGREEERPSGRVSRPEQIVEPDVVRGGLDPQGGSAFEDAVREHQEGAR